MIPKTDDIVRIYSPRYSIYLDVNIFFKDYNNVQHLLFVYNLLYLSLSFYSMLNVSDLGKSC